MVVVLSWFPSATIEIKISREKTRCRRWERPQSTRFDRSSLAVELLGSLVEGNTLGSTVHGAESGDPELLSGLHDSGHPSALGLELLSQLELLLGHHLALLVEHQVRLGQSTLGPFRATIPHLAHGSSLHRSRNAFGLLRLSATDSSLSGFGCA